MLRVVVIEDSMTIRRYIQRTLSRTGDIEVVGEAEDGKTGIELCRRRRPDVITLDLVLPSMSGISVTEYLMAYQPTPILIVSASSNRDEAHKTYDALAAGAVDVLEKTPVSGAEGAWEEKLVAAVRMVARIKVMTHSRGRFRVVPTMPPKARSRPRTDGPIDGRIDGALSVVAFGASTGGPGAISQILVSLCHPFPLPVLVVQHLSPMFSYAYAEWLDRQSPHRVAYVRDGEPLAEAHGRVILALPDKHLVVRDGRVWALAGAERNFCRPSVDILFESLADEMGPATVAALLTGMGRDGAEGLLRVRRAGGKTFAQDEASSTVYGMPREAAVLGAADAVLPLVNIGPAISELVMTRG
ncbi:MAG: chemotaxis-specific protein-glutamate methyltransferase CheB [Planctomycetes bacterium]|nr:chemotaxis-specific protein-glutamate methyltransferase CheB [Planctomycetota bacterium]